MSIVKDLELVEEVLKDITPWVNPLSSDGKKDLAKIASAVEALHRISPLLGNKEFTKLCLCCKRFDLERGSCGLACLQDTMNCINEGMKYYMDPSL